ncbi:VanZ family protein [Comamonas sp. Y33R10-2]|uniref:VanZ family protein n=1 Tax=Comamonas sp. Y33R10-2 TaxID=2853257 RepID=UPI001C5CB446|nr:VanZ family protein [Comamonas sp. Y33R10-2]QXZ10743.1 VanZ family protein [Comamonas sp. Y33R10-2]
MHSLSQSARAARLWKVLAWLSLCWALFVLWGCLNETGTSGGLILRLLPFLRGFEYTDKLVHAGLHGVLASLLWSTAWARAHAEQSRWSGRAALAVVLICASYGGVIELLQAGFTTTRGAEWLDALANTTGAALAVLFWQSLRGLLFKKDSA